MIRIDKADDRYHAEHGWLDSRFSFSFAEYYDPSNLQFGPMRVLNDDRIAPGHGFDMHPHREMEIVSIVTKGALEHKDSMGHTVRTSWGEIQRMSAGTGVLHSEYNPSQTEETNLLQMWFLPSERGLAPSYETTTFDTAGLRGRLVPVVSSRSAEGVAHIHQDMTIYLAELEPGQPVEFEMTQDRRVFVFVLEGSVGLKGATKEMLERRDAARIADEAGTLTLSTDAGGTVMLIDLP